MRLESGGVSIIIAWADPSGKAERGVSILTGIFDCLVLAGVGGSCLGVSLGLSTLGVEACLFTPGVVSVGGAGIDLGSTTVGFYTHFTFHLFG